MCSSSTFCINSMSQILFLAQLETTLNMWNAKRQQSPINYVYCLGLCELTKNTIIICLVAQICQTPSLKGEAIICFFFLPSLPFVCALSALAHELQTSSLIKSDQWGIGRMLRRTQLTNLACQRQRKSKGWVEERWGYKGKAVSASSGTSCAWALCTQPCTNNRWGFFSTLLFNGSGFDFSFLLSCLQLSGVCWTPEMRQSLVSGIVFLSTNVPQFPTVSWLKTC